MHWYSSSDVASRLTMSVVVSLVAVENAQSCVYIIVAETLICLLNSISAFAE